jgi:voltage-gated potassium channel
MTLETWERRAELPLAVAALVFLGGYAWPILQPDLASGLLQACRVVTWLVWLMFVADYLIRLRLASDGRAFVRRNVVDLLIIALPILRPLRLLRLVVLLRVLNRGATTSLRGRVAVYVTGAVILLVTVASLAELDAERGHEGANIETFGDALWWSVTTITTVGYGDRFPVTTLGRLIAVGLMLSGIALIGIVTASMATWLLDHVRATEQETQADVAVLAAEIGRLRGQIELLTSVGVRPATDRAQDLP